MTTPFRADAGLILRLAGPVWIGQIAAITYAVVDTSMIARTSAQNLAALAVGGSVYVTIFVGLQGIVQAVSPIIGQLLGAGRLRDIGRIYGEAAWLALGVAALAVMLLMWTTPWVWLARADAELAVVITHYLYGLACAAPAAVGFRLFASLNTALSRPHVTMQMQLVGLAFKIFLNWLLIFQAGWGAAGCAWATAIVMWGLFVSSLVILFFDPFYQPFALRFGKSIRPHWAYQRELLKLGLPLGATYLIEVSGFTFMALFIARMGAVPVAGHQIVSNIATVLFMTPLALGQATSVLVAQSLGARDAGRATRLGWRGIQLGAVIAVLMAMMLWFLRYPILHAYTSDAAIMGAALSLLSACLLYHVMDSLQTIGAFVLRGHKIVTLPMVIYGVAGWGLGLGGGYVLAFNVTGLTPFTLQGAMGFWVANIVGMGVAAGLLCLTIRQVTALQSTHLRDDPR